MNPFFHGIFDWIRKVYVDPAIRMLRLKAAIYYLEGVKGARRILILLCLLIFVITLIGAGLVLVPVALLLFMPWEPQTKAIVGTVIGVIYLVVPLMALVTLLSEKRWMRLTGANDILRKLLE